MYDHLFDLVSLGVSVAILVYLVYTLINPEKF